MNQGTINMAAYPSTNNRKRIGSERQFPGRLHNMMAFAEKEGYEHVIGWVLNGRGVMVYSPEGLVNLLPLFFSQTKYRSFRRQLNMWHFERVEHGPNKGAFIHPYFVKDNRELCSYMCRQMHLAKPRDQGQPMTPIDTTPEPRTSLRTDNLVPIAYVGSQQDIPIVPFQDLSQVGRQLAQNGQEIVPTSCPLLEPIPLSNVQLEGTNLLGQDTSGTSTGYVPQLTDIHLQSSRHSFNKFPTSVAEKGLQRKIPPMNLSKVLPFLLEKNETPIGLEPISLDGLFPFNTPTSTDPLDLTNLEGFDFSS
eukprot:Nitzschia sp. Nitz4//scaffold246_size28974//131//1048//NITZ4_008079-RA/size28974-exonerate_est2genome-gene-0.29-mRNA-1//1//CDS//3329543903//2105//frame0